MEPLEARQLLAVDAELLNDIHLGTYVTGAGGAPTGFTEVGSAVYFTAPDDASSNRLWRTDGTSTGTAPVFGVAATNLTNVSGTLYFSAGTELYKSDGTSSGTSVLKSFLANLNGGESVGALTNVGGTLFFRGRTSEAGVELWRSDGTSSGTELVRDIFPGATESFITDLLSFNNRLYFLAQESFSAKTLWQSDGTSTGTIPVVDVPRCSNLTNLGGTLLFTSLPNASSPERQLWRSDGTSSGTTLAVDMGQFSMSTQPGSSANVAGLLYFSGYSNASGQELWATDGTSSGTRLVRDIHPGTSGGFPADSSPGELTNVGGALFFSANDGTGKKLWRSDGTCSGTMLVRGPTMPDGMRAYDRAEFSGLLYFRCEGELWRSDGTSTGTALVRDIRAGGNSLPRELRNVGGLLYFYANDGWTGAETWVSDGTSAGTRLLRDLTTRTGSSLSVAAPYDFTIVADRVFFSAQVGNDGGPRLWRTDGTSSGTTQVASDSGEPVIWSAAITNWNGTLVVAGSGALARAGTDSPTQMIRAFGVNGNLANLTPVGDTLFFTAFDSDHGTELWKTDGTCSGTVLVRDIVPGGYNGYLYSSVPRSLTNLGGKLLFSTNPDFFPGPPGSFELWQSDGSCSGTTLVKEIYPGTGKPDLSDLTVVGDMAYFAASDGPGSDSRGLWKTDGTSSGTVKIASINPANLTNVNGTLYFTVSTFFPGDERKSGLWKSDGTSTGTVQILSFRIGRLTLAGDKLFFNLASGANQTTLHCYDTAASSTLTLRTFPTFSKSGDIAPVGVGSVYYFAANDVATGVELWRSDGTASGTILVEDIRPGAASSYPQYLRNGRGTLYFAANDGWHGIEPWGVRPEVPPPILGDANGDGQVGTADYAIWAATFGQQGAGLAADFDGNGEVGTGDYAHWAANFGKTAGGTGSAARAIIPGLIPAAASGAPNAVLGRTSLGGNPAPSVGRKFAAALAKHAGNLTSGEANRALPARPTVATRGAAPATGPPGPANSPGGANLMTGREGSSNAVTATRAADWLFTRLGRRS